jgi:translation initiation factor IF-3
MDKRRGRKTSQQEVRVRINEDIRYPEVRLLGENGEQLGIVSAAKARQLAADQSLDLVEISDKAKPPVCKMMNYDKYRYELKKKQQEAKKKQTVVDVKEVKFRPKTEEHDLDFKIKNILKFVEKKSKVKITMQFRGREIVHAQTVGREAMRKIADALREDCAILQEPNMEGRFMIMFVGPKA